MKLPCFVCFKIIYVGLILSLVGTNVFIPSSIQSVFAAPLGQEEQPPPTETSTPVQTETSVPLPVETNTLTATEPSISVPTETSTPPLIETSAGIPDSSGMSAEPALGSYFCSEQSQIPISECNVLITLYNSTNGGGWTNKSGWLVSGTPCTWYGVTCTDGHVTSLDLYSNKLGGSIPPELGSLTNLTYLQLNRNQLSGSIPPELGNLTQLQSLILDSNVQFDENWNKVGGLSGIIPPELGSLTKLTHLDLGDNQLGGSIPSQLGNLTKLEMLELYSNKLSGSIPPELGNLTKLSLLWLYDNQLSGSIPSQLGNLTMLTWLELNLNQLSGSIPSQLGNLTNLQQLWLFNNQLSGEIPSTITNLINIPDAAGTYHRLKLSTNRLYSTNAAVRSYLLKKDPDWESTQIICYKLTVTSSPTAGGTPTATPANSSGCSAGQYVAGKTITLSPGTKTGYTFSNWTGATVTSNILTMPASATTVTANYRPITSTVCYQLTKIASPLTGGTITASPALSTGCVTGKYKAGQVITFTAVPKLYYHFDRWVGGVNATTNKLTMPARATTIYGYFGANLRRGTTYNDTYTAGIDHTSTWLTQSNRLYYGGTQHFTRTRTSSITINYTGTRLGMYYTAGKAYSRVSIKIDNRAPVVLNEYASATTYKKLWWSVLLPNANHKVVITYYTGNAVNATVNFDGVIIQ